MKVLSTFFQYFAISVCLLKKMHITGDKEKRGFILGTIRISVSENFYRFVKKCKQINVRQEVVMTYYSVRWYCQAVAGLVLFSDNEVMHQPPSRPANYTLAYPVNKILPGHQCSYTRYLGFRKIKL